MGLVVSGWRWSSESNTGRIWSVKCAAAAAAKGRGNDESLRSYYNHLVDTLPSLSHSNPTWIHLPLILGWWRLVEAPDLAVLVHLARSVAQGIPGQAAHAPVAREAASLGDRFARGLCWDLDQWNVAQWCLCLLPDLLKKQKLGELFFKIGFCLSIFAEVAMVTKKPSKLFASPILAPRRFPWRTNWRHGRHGPRPWPRFSAVIQGFWRHQFHPKTGKELYHQLQ